MTAADVVSTRVVLDAFHLLGVGHDADMIAEIIIRSAQAASHASALLAVRKARARGLLEYEKGHGPMSFVLAVSEKGFAHLEELIQRDEQDADLVSARAVLELVSTRDREMAANVVAMKLLEAEKAPSKASALIAIARMLTDGLLDEESRFPNTFWALKINEKGTARLNELIYQDATRTGRDVTKAALADILAEMGLPD